MLTLRHIEEMMVNSLRTPLALCHRLGLKPTKDQYALLEQLEGYTRTVDLEIDNHHEVTRAVAIYALWRTLAHPGSRCTVIASWKGLASPFMGFLHRVTTEIDPAMNAVVRWSSWRVMKIGADPGQDIRLLPHHAACVEGRRAGIHTIVVLGAGESDPAFCEVRKALDDGQFRPGETIVRLW